MQTKVEDLTSITDQLETFLNNIENFISLYENNRKIAFFISRTPHVTDNIVVAISAYKPETRLENIFKQMLLSYALKAEQLSALSSPVMLQRLIVYMRSFKSFKAQGLSDTHIYDKIFTEVKSQLSDVQDLTSLPSIEDLEAFLRKKFDKKTASIILSTINLAGPAGKISFDHKDVAQPIIESSSKFSFEVEPDQNILIQNKMKWDHNDVTTICIEGFIEKVSEIDIILNEAVNSKKPVLIICLGYSTEVISTIVSNNARGVFSIMIAKPFQESDTINDLSDIALAADAQFFGFQTGVISTAFDLDRFISSSSLVSIQGFTLDIRNNRSKAAVQSRLKKLKNSLGEDNTKDDYLKRRINSLTSNQTSIVLPDTDTQNKFNQIEDFDSALRSAKSIINFGIVDFDKENNLWLKGNHISSSVYVGVKLGYDLFKQLTSIENAIVFEN